jgi:hypothetical protein
MLEPEDRQAIVITVMDMLREQVTAPLERLIDCLLFELMSSDSIDSSRLAARLEELWSAMPEPERDGHGGRLYRRYLVLLTTLRDDPQRFLSSAPHTGERTAHVVPPDWFRGVIQGGREEGPDQG